MPVSAYSKTDVTNPPITKRDRFHAAIAGGAIDRPPVVAWCNFATDGIDGEENARRQLAFHRACDWDILKVMNDYRLSPPPGMDTVDSAADLRAMAAHLSRQSITDRLYAEQLECLQRLRAAVGPDVPIVDTLLEPFFSIMFAVGFSRAALVRSHPNEAHAMLDAHTNALEQYIAAIKRVPVDGVLYATNGCIIAPAARAISDDEYRAFHRPYDLRLLSAMQGLTRIVHAHGNPLDITRVLDYSCEVISWSDRLPGNPPIKIVRGLTTKCLMAGIDESTLHERSLPEVRVEVADAFRQAGRSNFILSSGCNINPGTSQRTLRALRAAALNC